jgi:hypothetical protein
MNVQDRMRIGAMALGLAMLAACSGENPTASDAATRNAPAVTADAACGAALPITGLCSNAVPAQFLRVDAQAPKLATQCVWRTQELSLTPSDAIIFRAQDCTAEGWVANTFEVVQNFVKYRMDGMPSDQAHFMLEIFPLSPGETAEQAAVTTLAKAPEDQRTRCETRPRTGPVVAGSAFELTANAELTAEMNALNPDEPWDACGPNGVTMDAEQFWEARKTYALFHMLGQDTPPWDPASFTFYRKGGDGNWLKAG